MYDFDKAETDGYYIRGDMGTTAALNDLERWIFNAFTGFPNEDAAWADMRQSEFGRALYEKMMQFDDFEFNGSAEENE